MTIAAYVLMGLGVGFVFVGSLGMLRFRDVYSRLQASGVSDNGGLGLILIGLILHSGWDRHDITLLLLLLLMLITNPIVTHSVARSACVQRHREEGER
ncbi:monovalent cation/H(+) antiporter subunit G [Candidatus Bipolaricaulota bacterium]|nr:monovalent cation/H(+) antiporter subunit G [Candidatus Bipolaricaulota bacterium]